MIGAAGGIVAAIEEQQNRQIHLDRRRRGGVISGWLVGWLIGFLIGGTARWPTAMERTGEGGYSEFGRDDGQLIRRCKGGDVLGKGGGEGGNGFGWGLGDWVGLFSIKSAESSRFTADAANASCSSPSSFLRKRGGLLKKGTATGCGNGDCPFPHNYIHYR
jgi:hypothetical protein